MFKLWNFMTTMALPVMALSLTARPALAQNKPFPQNRSYSQVTYPNHKSRALLSSDVKAYYDKWKLDFMKTSNGVTPGGGFYIEMKGTGGNGQEKTTSEAMGYGMVITVLMAGADPQAKTLFDGLFNMVSHHPSTVNKANMSWIIDTTELTSKDADSATDGDMDIAYALLLADQQWGSSGVINYKAQAVARIQNGLMTGIVNKSNNRLMLGDWWDSTVATGSRPSDWMGGHMYAFYRATLDPTWVSVRDNMYTMTGAIQTSFSPASGLLPDFVTGAAVAPAKANFLEGPHDGAYDYNSSRVPLRFALDFAHTGDPRAKASLTKIMTFFSTATGGDLSKLKAGYNLSGSAYATYEDLAFIGPAMAGATVAPQFQPMLNNAWEFVKANHVDYFGDSLTLLAMLHTSGNWWSPNDTATTPVPVPVPVPAPIPPPGVSCNFPNWVKGQSYAAGAIVKFTDGKLYIARMANSGSSPMRRTASWAPYTCSGSTPSPAPAPAPGPPPAPAPGPVPTGAQTGTVLSGVYVTLYGYDDNDDGSGNYGVSVISDPIIHKGATEDLGTFDHPSTFATDYAVAKAGTKIYVPRLHKYFIMEDTCRECTADKKKGKNHVDLYIGEMKLQGAPLISCEEALTVNSDTIIINPSNNYPVSAPKIFIGGKCNSVQFK